MAELKTDYKDQLLNSLVNTKRVYNLVDADGNVVRENVSLEDVTVYSQDGDNFGAVDINKTNEEVNQLNRNLTANGSGFYFDYQDGKYGFNTDPNRGADTFSPFSGGVLVWEQASITPTIGTTTYYHRFAFDANKDSVIFSWCNGNGNLRYYGLAYYDSKEKTFTNLAFMAGTYTLVNDTTAQFNVGTTVNNAGGTIIITAE